MTAARHRAVSRTAGWARTTAVAIALVAVSGLVVTRSASAFSDTTENVGNSLSTGSVVLSDDDAGVALFNVSGLTAGQSQSRCIEVSYTGSLALGGPVRLYGGYADGPDAGTTADSALAPWLDLTVQLGAPGARCTDAPGGTTVYDPATPAASAGTVASFAAVHTGWATGASTTWTPAPGSDATRAFRITVTVRDDNNAQAKTAEPTFTWEARTP